MKEPLPITGYSLCNALGIGRAAVRDALEAGRSGLGPSPVAVSFPTAVGAMPRELEPLTGALSPWSTRIARMVGLLIAELDGPLTAARARWRPERIAIVLGTSTAGAESTERAYGYFVEHGVMPAEYDFRRQHTYGALLHVVHGLTGAAGPSWVVSTACTSSAKTLASASRLIEADLADAVITGGVDTLCAMTLMGFRGLGALSDGACRPFGEGRDGISIGEGGALLLLERRGDARALLAGVGETSDAYHISAPHPEGRGATEAMTQALAQAGLAAEDIDHINAHGTGTPLNDIAESKAIAGIFGAQVPVVSTKGYTGHTLGAAGSTEAAMAVMAIEEGFIPGSLGAAPLDARIEVQVPLTTTRGRFRHVLSNSFAFGGNNTSVLVSAP
ncbi:MAG: beta-ketoacyl-ACP synthase [Deltaproteobacteria bacterium]|nr:beta-ketoacyl-ACP synthase [Deltaproteobacteria bacterium]MCB9786240.1 beta-ketoacyl-ACP synthase [Deltaproteobacteria bacterium]